MCGSPPRSTRTATLCPHPTLSRSDYLLESEPRSASACTDRAAKKGADGALQRGVSDKQHGEVDTVVLRLRHEPARRAHGAIAGHQRADAHCAGLQDRKSVV